MIELHIIDYTQFTAKSGRVCRMVSLWYKSPTGFCHAGTYFVPNSYAGPDPKPSAVMHGVVYGDKLIALDK